MQTITTKYLGVTNTKGKRIKAITASGISATIDYNHSMDDIENHNEAVKKLKEKLDWNGDMVSGSTKYGRCYVFLNDFYILKD